MTEEGFLFDNPHIVPLPYYCTAKQRRTMVNQHYMPFEIEVPGDKDDAWANKALLHEKARDNSRNIGAILWFFVSRRGKGVDTRG